MNESGKTSVVDADGRVPGTVGADDLPAVNTLTMAPEPEILEIRWGLQIRSDDRTWHDYSQGTWPEAEKSSAEDLGATIYGGEVQTRLFKTIKMVDPDWTES